MHACMHACIQCGAASRIALRKGRLIASIANVKVLSSPGQQEGWGALRRPHAAQNTTTHALKRHQDENRARVNTRATGERTLSNKRALVKRIKLEKLVVWVMCG